MSNHKTVGTDVERRHFQAGPKSHLKSTHLDFRVGSSCQNKKKDFVGQCPCNPNLCCSPTINYKVDICEHVRFNLSVA